MAAPPFGPSREILSPAPGKSSAWQIVIVNYKTAGLAVRAARAARLAAPGAQLVVVDNASGESPDALAPLGDVAQQLSLRENRGYAAALNAGARESNSDYLLLLNADVELTFGSVRLLEHRFVAMPRLGIMAPRLLSPDQSIQPSSRRFPTHRSLLLSRGSPLGRLPSKSNRAYRLPEPSTFTLTDVVAGACMAVRRTTWNELGGMDEDFFLYAEDTDLCLRAKRAGWLVGYDPGVPVRHDWGASTRLARRRSHRLHAQSLSRYFYKHFPERPTANLCVSWLLRIHSFLRF